MLSWLYPAAANAEGIKGANYETNIRRNQARFANFSSRKMQRFVFVLFASLSAAALFASSGVHCMRPLLRLPRDAPTTGRYIAVLSEDTSHQRLLDLVEIFKTIPGCRVYTYMDKVLKAIVVDLSDHALEKVNARTQAPRVLTHQYNYS